MPHEYVYRLGIYFFKLKHDIYTAEIDEAVITDLVKLQKSSLHSHYSSNGFQLIHFKLIIKLLQTT